MNGGVPPPRDQICTNDIAAPPTIRLAPPMKPAAGLAGETTALASSSGPPDDFGNLTPSA